MLNLIRPADKKVGIIFDCNSMCLIGEFTDELSAHRAKKRWKQIYNEHFEIYCPSDFDIWVEDVRVFIRHESASARYAYWCMVNKGAERTLFNLTTVKNIIGYESTVIPSNAN